MRKRIDFATKPLSLALSLIAVVAPQVITTVMPAQGAETNRTPGTARVLRATEATVATAPQAASAQTVSANAQAASNRADAARKTDARQADTLRRAIGMIDGNPKDAARALKELNDCEAKAYLAYLYVTKKVAVPGASKKVDALMNSAIAMLSKNPGLGDIDPSQIYHYSDTGMLIRHLRFINDASGCVIAVPVSIAKEHPAEFFSAFGSYWGSSRDGMFSCHISRADDINSIPEVENFLRTMIPIFGEMQGTIRFTFYRNERMSELKASLAPQLFFSKTAPPVDQNLDSFLQRWSNDELFNKHCYNAWVDSRKPAELALARHYQNHFNFSAPKSTAHSNQALRAIATVYLGNYPTEAFKKWQPSEIYKLLTSKNTSLAKIQLQFEHAPPSQEDLETALRLAILNKQSLEIIDFLLKKGAPLTGVREPAISSSVERPEVVALLLKNGAKVDEENALGKTALFQAAQFNNLASCKVLLEAGADVNHKMIPADGEKSSELNNEVNYWYSRGEMTPLMYALAFSDYNLIHYLLDKGADKDSRDSHKSPMKSYLDDNQRLSKMQKAELGKLFK